MKFLRFLFLGIIFGSPQLLAENSEERRAAAIGAEMENFTGADGRIYKDVRITRIDDGGISIRHSTGTARLRYGDLTPSQRLQYGLDHEDALETYRREVILREKYEEAVAEKEMQRASAAAERYREKLEAEAKLAAAMKTALSKRERQELSTPIPNNPPVQFSNAVFPTRSVTYRGYSGYGYYPSYRPYCSPRGYRYGASFSYRSPNFSIIIR
ncbi:MAG: hypothetical protein NWT08_10730 [Akkermansiaceae bacterium]|jgi:hypothetical protein|nr:hypothetical protein [Akkermansiaceae bacterium]MDP4647261.1 hypothetical protein [Akkermansiaceae bacterium]MDP4722513.1 hypothetical protein [Akkermansiaceae bacterium]MDP4781041.1 hypothetical protein [Akkermansiaceae bacterium]MDP4848525.1 hypothetical protein [Akkermansiaceae bacterium]